MNTKPAVANDTGVPHDELKANPITDAVPVREMRVAVSMVGGSSLAIYENGVAQEFFRMVHGQGIYGVLKRLTHSHAYVDILSGTSAGGINTVMLSAALTVGTNFLTTRQAWIQTGDIDALLQNPKSTDVRSLFRGNTYYIEQLQKIFDQLSDSDPKKQLCWELEGEKPGVPSGRDAATQEYGDLDLFVTGTYFRAQPQTFFDARTQPIFNNNHAGIFHLKHRARRQESHFHPDLKDCATPPPALKAPPAPAPWPGAIDDAKRRREGVRDRLAWVARTTSSLPGVFETANISRELMNGIIALPENAHHHYMGDGGYLNKRPLNLVLQAITMRAAHREVVRKIFFVEPRAEELAPAEAKETAEPNALQHALFALTVPGQQNLSASLEELYAHNKKVRRINSALETARAALWQSIAKPQTQSPIPTYQQKLWLEIRLQELRDQLIDIWGHVLGLEGFEGISTVPNPLDVRKQQVKNARPLRELRSQLLQLMESNCIELHTLEHDSTPAPADESESLTFSLREIDTEGFKRKIARAIEEIYRALYPMEDNSEPMRSDDRMDADSARADRTHERTERRVRELYHLLDLAEIVNENLIAVVGRFTTSPEYRAAVAITSPEADGAAKKNAVQALWDLMVGALRDLLRPLDEWPQRIEESEPVGVGESERLKREQANAETLRTTLENRAKTICEALPAQDDTSGLLRAQWKVYARQPNPGKTPLTLQIDDYADDLIFNSAINMERVLLPRTRAANSPATTNPSAWLGKITRMKVGKSARAAIKENFEYLDAALYPVERAAEMVCRTPLELVQISTRDVQIGLSDKPVGDKLGGDMLANLSAFLKSSWRANDILWGRLDASAAIAQTLLEPDRLQRIVKPTLPGEIDWEVAARMMGIVDDYVLAGNVISTAKLHGSKVLPVPDSKLPQPPEAKNDDAAGIFLRAQYLGKRDEIWQQLLGNKPHVSAEPTESGDIHRGEPLLYWLLRRHQLEILMQEVPFVVGEAVADHAQWQGRKDSESFAGFPPPPSATANAEIKGQDAKIKGNTADKDAANAPMLSARDVNNAARVQGDKLAGVAGFGADAPVHSLLRRSAHEWAKNLFSRDRHAPDPQTVENYFKRDYAVGSETVGDIPPLVLLRRGLVLCLIVLHLASNSLPTNFKNGAAGQKVSQFILRPLSLFVGALHGFVTVLAQGTAAAAALHTLIWTLFVGVAVARLLGAELPFWLSALAFVGIVLEFILWLCHPHRWRGLAVLFCGVGLGLTLFFLFDQFWPAATTVAYWKQLTTSYDPQIFLYGGLFAIIVAVALSLWFSVLKPRRNARQ